MTAPAIPLPAEERAIDTRWFDWVGTVDHKRIGILYMLDGALLLPGRRLRGAARTLAARGAARAPALARGLQPDLHDARHDDDLPRRHARAHRLRQLRRAAHDRRARHGLPAPERDGLLALPAGRLPPALQLARGRRTERGLVQLRAAQRDAVHGHRARRRLLGDLARRAGHQHGRERDQPHRDDRRAPRAGHDDASRAALRLDGARQLILDGARAARAHRLVRTAARRPPLQRAPVPAVGGWLGHHVAALLLELRSPRGLHHGAAGLRDDLGGRSRLRAQADLRIRVRRRVDGRHRRPLLRRLGAPHVRGGLGAWPTPPSPRRACSSPCRRASRSSAGSRPCGAAPSA